ncbi:MAG: hypothetical protein AB1715_03965 [Acidobacteriota bacterium]
MRAAGFERQDLERLVEKDGVEGALGTLFRHGVYLTAEEFKGRSPIVRGNLRMFVHPNSFRINAQASRLTVKSSGTSGLRTPVPIDLDYIRSRSVNALLLLIASQGTHWVHGLWAVPGSSALVYLLELAGGGVRAARWFSQVNPSSCRLHPRYRWSVRGIRWASLLSGHPLPKLTHAPLDAPWPILD